MTDDWGHDDVQREADPPTGLCERLRLWWRLTASPWIVRNL